MKPAFSDDWTTVYSVDALTGANLLPEKSVHCIATSPPYWGLRSYLAADHPDKAMELGAEKTPEEYVEKLVEIFRALRRVLRDDGTLWLNLGDSYYPHNGSRGNLSAAPDNKWIRADAPSPRLAAITGIKSKDLVGIPWLTAFALRADGWYLRSDIIWSKPNPMPESVTDRPTKSHEYMFLLTKSPRYFFDQEAVREKFSENEAGWIKSGPGNTCYSTDGIFQPGSNGKESSNLGGRPNSSGRNIRSVWNIATQPYLGAHYATFPPTLIYPCIKAGTSERGACEACGAPWERVVERPKAKRSGEVLSNTRDGGLTMEYGLERTGMSHYKYNEWLQENPPRTVGWQPTCSCSADTVPATVLDPFMGSGTTSLAARKLGRKSIGFDLDERNIKQIEERLGYQGVLL